MCIRVRPRFFDQVGHETMYASSGNKHSHIAIVVRPPWLKSFANQKTCQMTEW